MYYILFVEAAIVMASCGLNFIVTNVAPGAVVDGKAVYNKSKFNQSNNSNTNTKAASENTSVLTLEPNLYQLVSSFCVHAPRYNVGQSTVPVGITQSPSMILAECRKFPYMSPEVKNIIHLELKKHLIQQQVS